MVTRGKRTGEQNVGPASEEMSPGLGRIPREGSRILERERGVLGLVFWILGASIWL